MVDRERLYGALAFPCSGTSGLAEWVISLVEHDVFHFLSEAVFVAMQSFRELDDHPDVKQALLNRAIQKGIDSAEQGRAMPAADVLARLRKEMEGLLSGTHRRATSPLARETAIVIEIPPVVRDEDRDCTICNFCLAESVEGTAHVDIDLG